jgi:hypothetical protein
MASSQPRVFMKDFQWCSLNPEKPLDVEKFKEIMKGNFEKWHIEVTASPNPSIGRIIIKRP